ncbi:MAG: hypothetical protein WD830_00525 [Chloroflexota bacterium]
MTHRNRRRSPAKNQPPPPPWRRSGPLWILVGIVVVVAIGVVVVAAVLKPREAAGPVSWTRLGTQDVHSLAFPGPDTSTVLFGHHGGILRSADGGRSWAPLPVRQDAMGMAAAADGSIVIAGHLVFEASRDGGTTWAPINSDLPSLDIHGFARSLSDPSRMWAYLAEGGIYESTDFGTTWAQVNGGDVVQLTAIRRDDQDELLGIDLRGLVRSTDEGRTWLVAGTPPTAPIGSLAATPDGGVIVLGGPDGLYRSDDTGATWRHVLESRAVLATAISSDGNTIAAVTQDTLYYRSDDGGTTWPGPA